MLLAAWAGFRLVWLLFAIGFVSAAAVIALIVAILPLACFVLALWCYNRLVGRLP